MRQTSKFLNYGRVYVSGTDELGDFKVGTFARIENRTGNITFTGTVTISEVEFLKLKGGDVVVTGFDNSNTLGGANATDSKLPTQKAVKISSPTTLVHTSTNHILRTLFLEHWLNLLTLVRFQSIRFQH